MFSILLSFPVWAPIGIDRGPSFYRNHAMYIPPLTCSTLPVT